MIRNYFLLFLFAVVVGVKAETLSDRLKKDATPWTDESNKPFHFTNLDSQFIVLTAAYTECKKTCPLTTMVKLRELRENAKVNNVSIEIAIVTMDPENDTPEKLTKFKKIHEGDDHWHFLRTDLKSTKNFVKQFELGDFWKSDDHIQHSFKIQIIDVKRKSVRILNWDQQEVGDYFTSPAQ